MSYSFNVRASTKEVAIDLAAKKLLEVAEAQPMHEFDIDKALDAVRSFAQLIPESPDHDISISVSGNLGWVGDPHAIVSVSVGVSVGHLYRGI